MRWPLLCLQVFRLSSRSIEKLNDEKQKLFKKNVIDFVSYLAFCRDEFYGRAGLAMGRL